MFSTITTAPSTMIPKSIAPRLMRLPLTPSLVIPAAASSMDKGIAAVTIKAARTLPSSSSRIAATSNAPSARFFQTVRNVASIRSRRS